MDLKDIGKKKYLGKGNCAKCYLLENGYVLKKFNNPLSIENIERFKYFLNYANENFLFPFDFLYDENKLYAYISKYSFGKSLENVFLTSSLDDLSINSSKLENNMDYVSSGKIIMHDFHTDNILYDGKILHVNDVDEFSIRDFSSVEEAKRKNYNAYKDTISKLFITKLALNKHTLYLLDRIDKYRNSDAKVSEIIPSIKDDMEKYVNEQINTVEEFNSIIKR